jgi:hypothetical protein
MKANCGVVQSGAQWFTTFTPPLAMNDRVRFTIAVDQEVYDAFADLAHTSGVSLSRCIGDWLRDTAEAAQITTIKLHEVRRSPQEAYAAFVDAIAIGSQRFLADPSARWTGEARPSRATAGGPLAQPVAAGRRLGKPQHPPSSNTGGKSPTKHSGTR